MRPPGHVTAVLHIRRMSSPKRGRRLAVLVLALLLLAGLAAARARADDPLVLGREDTPGLKPARATVANARRAVGVAVSPARFPVPAGRAHASHLTRPGVQLWSLAFVGGTPAVADISLRRI